jgi:phospholipase D1/2
MAGAPFKVGRFAHTLRVRLMREHVGVDVDALTEEDYVSREDESYHQQAQEQWDPNAEQESPGHHVTELAHERPIHDTLHTAAHGIKEGTKVLLVTEASLTSDYQGALTAEHNVAESLSNAFQPAVANGEVHDLEAKKEGPSPQEGHALCPLDEEKPVGFTGADVPTVGAEALKHPLPTLEIEEPCSADEPSAREGQKSESNVDKPFDAHAAGWEVVDGGAHTADGSPHSMSNHSDLAEDQSTAYKWSDRTQQRHLHEAKGKEPDSIPAPYIHPDCFEDPISDEFWEDIWVACAEHNVSALSVSRVLTH